MELWERGATFRAPPEFRAVRQKIFAEFFFLVRPTSPKKGDFLQSRQTENGTQEKSVKEKAAIQTAKQLVEVPAKFKWD